MFDIHIRNLLDIEIEVVKASFITEKREYSPRAGVFCFYADTVQSFFEAVKGITEFYSAHHPPHCHFNGFECGVDEDGTYYISSIGYD